MATRTMSEALLEHQKPPRILFWDIETAPIVAATWGLYDQTIPTQFIVHDWYIICAAWQWAGSSRVESVSNLADPEAFEADFRNDAHTVTRLHEVLSEADVLVAHNGDKFDLKKFNARAIFHGLPPLPPIQTVDTLKEVRKVAKFTSNRLDDLADSIGFENKIENPKGLWMDAGVYGKKTAIRHMVKYNRGDIPPLISLYEALAPYSTTRPSQCMNGELVCPNCGGFVVRATYKNGEKRTKRTRRAARPLWKCKDCGHHSTSTKAVARARLG